MLSDRQKAQYITAINQILDDLTVLNIEQPHALAGKLSNIFKGKTPLKEQDQEFDSQSVPEWLFVTPDMQTDDERTQELLNDLTNLLKKPGDLEERIPTEERHAHRNSESGSGSGSGSGYGSDSDSGSGSGSGSDSDSDDAEPIIEPAIKTLIEERIHKKIEELHQLTPHQKRRYLDGYAQAQRTKQLNEFLKIKQTSVQNKTPISEENQAKYKPLLIDAIQTAFAEIPLKDDALIESLSGFHFDTIYKFYTNASLLGGLLAQSKIFTLPELAELPDDMFIYLLNNSDDLLSLLKSTESEFSQGTLIQRAAVVFLWMTNKLENFVMKQNFADLTAIKSMTDIDKNVIKRIHYGKFLNLGDYLYQDKPLKKKIQLAFQALQKLGISAEDLKQGIIPHDELLKLINSNEFSTIMTHLKQFKEFLQQPNVSIDSIDALPEEIQSLLLKKRADLIAMCEEHNINIANFLSLEPNLLKKLLLNFKKFKEILTKTSLDFKTLTSLKPDLLSALLFRSDTINVIIDSKLPKEIFLTLDSVQWNLITEYSVGLPKLFKHHNNLLMPLFSLPVNQQFLIIIGYQGTLKLLEKLTFDQVTSLDDLTLDFYIERADFICFLLDKISFEALQTISLTVLKKLREIEYQLNNIDFCWQNAATIEPKLLLNLPDLDLQIFKNLGFDWQATAILTPKQQLLVFNNPTLKSFYKAGVEPKLLLTLQKSVLDLWLQEYEILLHFIKIFPATRLLSLNYEKLHTLVSSRSFIYDLESKQLVPTTEWEQLDDEFIDIIDILYRISSLENILKLMSWNELKQLPKSDKKRLLKNDDTVPIIIKQGVLSLSEILALSEENAAKLLQEKSYTIAACKLHAQGLPIADLLNLDKSFFQFMCSNHKHAIRFMDEGISGMDLIRLGHERLGSLFNTLPETLDKLELSNARFLTIEPVLWELMLDRCDDWQKLMKYGFENATLQQTDMVTLSWLLSERKAVKEWVRREVSPTDILAFITQAPIPIKNKVFHMMRIPGLETEATALLQKTLTFLRTETVVTKPLVPIYGAEKSTENLVFASMPTHAKQSAPGFKTRC